MLENPFLLILDRLDRLDSIESAINELRQLLSPDKAAGPMRMKEAAQYLGISVQTLYQYVMSGKIKPKKAGKFSLFYREDLDRMIRGESEKIDPTNFIKNNKAGR